MSNPSTDCDLTRAHELFKENHEAGRKRLLEILSQDASHLRTGRHPAKSVFRVLTAPPWSDGWKRKMAVAAVLFLFVSIGFYAFFHGMEHAAYALDDLPDRLLTIKSICVKGWTFHPDFMSEQNKKGSTMKKYPLVIFAERPDCYWQNWYRFTRPDGTHKDVLASSHYAACKGSRRLDVSNYDKKIVETTVPAVQSELATEKLLQVELPQQWLNGNLRDFVKTGTETVNGVFL